ncbi:MAG: GNAT family N-acetyltransferase [Gemmatimonadaceae bacterium]
MSILIGQLGYPSTAEEMPSRLAAVDSHPGADTRVAVVAGQVVGIATVHVFASIHSSSPVAWLTTLVVAEGARGKGIGRLLLAWAEDYARSHGAARISLTSALHRAEAHKFYINLRYTHSGKRFTKTLTDV